MKYIYLLVGMVCFSFAANSQTNKPQKSLHFSGMYLQWGYNMVWFTKSNIHFKMNNGDNFTLHSAKAKQRTSFDAIYKKPLEISIPQYNIRAGFYLNKEKTKALEINFDHTKYVVTDGQKVKVTGTLEGKEVNKKMIIDPIDFLHIEHTDGANFLHFNYVEQHHLHFSEKKQRNIFTYLWKAGAGFNIPKTDFTYKGRRLNNKFHIAGFNISAESGFRFYPTRTFFIELAGKTGYVNYLDALADTPTEKGNRAHHHFLYFEAIATVGGDIDFKKEKRKGKKTLLN